MKKILVPTDFSPLASYATDAAIQIARLSGAEIYLLHVVEMPGSSFSVTGQVADNTEFDVYTLKLIARTKGDLAKVVQENREEVQMYSTLKVGNAFKAIAQVIAEQEVDLVIMGSHGADGWEEAFVGSNAERVVRRANCPVMVIKGPVKLSEIQNVVFAADFEEKETVIQRIKSLQELLGAKLHLVKINTPSNFVSDHEGMQTIRDFGKKYDLNHYTVNIYNDREEERGILYFAEEVNADLIALGTHGHRGLQHLLNGSLAENLVNHAKLPVWTCRI
jgi:nucleotide-binding universal stress UspA family protein